MVSLSSASQALTTLVGNFSDALEWLPARKPRLHLPIKDTAAEGVVIPITWPCFHDDQMIGVVGLDIHLADIVEDVTYFTAPQKNAYVFLMDINGMTHNCDMSKLCENAKCNYNRHISKCHELCGY